MEVSKWKEIWEKKSIDLKQKIILDDLIKADGFDNGVGSYDESSWRRLVADIQSRINVKATENVLEIGCGGGILAEALSELGANVTGIDASENTIGVAKSHSRSIGSDVIYIQNTICLLYTSPSPRDLSTSRMPSSA